MIDIVSAVSESQPGMTYTTQSGESPVDRCDLLQPAAITSIFVLYPVLVLLFDRVDLRVIKPISNVRPSVHAYFHIATYCNYSVQSPSTKKFLRFQ